ncbi:MBL fold metallo-hydrolase [Algivirga pacifica]|uniref:MBL fold metallo-hydrolase n=1 Tax=Algivirga pacifica TaxID=1162670 RepID=A0ABP9DHD4_9BACT
MIYTIDLHFLENEHAIAAFLVETDAGPILIETGPYSTYPQLKKGVEEHGHKIEEIKHVFITHIHLDHAGAAWKLAEHGAKIYMHPFGKKHMADPSKLMASAKRIYKEDMERLWSDMKAIPEEQIVEVGHGDSIHIGSMEIIGWHTPGHANHHIAWQIHEILFTGDVAGVKIGDGPAVAPCPPPDISLEKWKNSLDMIRGMHIEKLFLTHYGEIVQIKEHLDQVEEHMHKIANWIKEQMDKGIEAGEMTPLFDEWEQENLKSCGADDAMVAQYAAANPCWMSVAGLMRYWGKKDA